MNSNYKKLIVIGLVIVLLFATSYFVYSEISNNEVEYTKGRLI